MWSWPLVCGLFADNVGLLSVNVVQKQPLFAVQGVYVCGPLQLPLTQHRQGNVRNNTYTKLRLYQEFYVVAFKITKTDIIP
jgi:hypothetical protein